MAVDLLAPVVPTKLAAPMRTPEPPPLEAGDRLTRAEFHRRYLAHPEIGKAELIEGIVYMPSPMKHRRHGMPHLRMSGWVSTYMAATPNLDGSDNTTVLLDNANEVQPDILLRLEPEHGGQSRIGPDDYVVGAPELIVEVAATSASYDMHDKLRIYARNGVREYLVALTYEQQVRWFVLRKGEYEELAPGADGILRSEVFPGLWLDPAALWRQDLAGLLTALQMGLTTPEHATFVAQLAAASTT